MIAFPNRDILQFGVMILVLTCGYSTSQCLLLLPTGWGGLPNALGEGGSGSAQPRVEPGCLLARSADGLSCLGGFAVFDGAGRKPSLSRGGFPPWALAPPPVIPAWCVLQKNAPPKLKHIH